MTGLQNPMLTPIYPVFEQFSGLRAAYTGKGTSRENYHFSFQRSRIDRRVLDQNLQHYGKLQSFDPATVTWPNGSWPHSGQAIAAEEHDWITSPSTGGIVPISRTNSQPVVYDAIVTKSPSYVLGVQGADCPSIFLYDDHARVIGLAHSGWKPTVRGVVRNTIELMRKLGASSEAIQVFVGPGVGDRFNEFQWDEAMEPYVREVFVVAGREDLLTNRSIRHLMSEEDCAMVKEATGREIRGGTTLALASLIVNELVWEGVREENIVVSEHSTICERLPENGTQPPAYRYHSARRDADKDPERPGFGSNLCVLFLEDG